MKNTGTIIKTFFKMQDEKKSTLKFCGPTFWLTLVFIVSLNFGFGQSDSLSYSTETKQDSTVDYLTPMEYAFMFHEETNWLFKANLLITNENQDLNNLKLSFEKKIAKGLSLDVVLLDYSYFQYNDDSGYGLGFSIATRWYYKYRKNLRNNKVVTNLSGGYIALGAGYRFSEATYNQWGTSPSLQFIPVFAKWGMQRRFLKHGYLDFGFKGGVNFDQSDHGLTSAFLGTYVDAGLAFTHDRQTLDFDKLCPVLKCHAADKFILKTNLVDIVSLGLIRKTFIGALIPNISAELKMGESPFSINAYLGTKLEYSRSGLYDFDTFTISPKVLVEGRYYYNLKRRMLMGKTGNGLSANYVALGAIYDGNYQTFVVDGLTAKYSNVFTGIMASTGIQRMISDHLYLDLNIGLGYGVEEKYDRNNDDRTSSDLVIYNLGVAIGYRF